MYLYDWLWLFFSIRETVMNEAIDEASAGINEATI